MRNFPFLPCFKFTLYTSSPLSLPAAQLSAEWHYLSFTMPSHYSTRDHTRDHFGQASSLVDRIIAALPGGLAAQVQRVWDRQNHNSVSTHGLRIPRSFRNAQRWNPKRLLSLPHLFVAVWVLLLLWGERWVFESAVQACEWERWERWVSRCREG